MQSDRKSGFVKAIYTLKALPLPVVMRTLEQECKLGRM